MDDRGYSRVRALLLHAAAATALVGALYLLVLRPVGQRIRAVADAIPAPCHHVSEVSK